MNTTRRTVTATLVLAMAATAGGVAMATAEPAGGPGSTCAGTCDSEGAQDTTRARSGNGGGAGMGRGRGGSGESRSGSRELQGNGAGSGRRTGNGDGAGNGGAGSRRAERNGTDSQRRGQGGGASSGRGMWGEPGDPDHQIAPAVPGATLSEEVEAALLYLAEEEKLAGDVYDLAADHQDVRAFTNIGRAEDRHLDSVQVLLERYDLDDPTEGAAAGEFTDPDLQALYDELAAEVTTDRASAVAAGVLIEKTDIADLEQLLADVDLPADVEAVAENLLAGSQRHLVAFQRQS